MATSQSSMSNHVPRNETGPEFEKVFRGLDGSSRFSQMDNRARQQFLDKNKSKLLRFGITNIDQLHDRTNGMQKSAFRRFLIDPIKTGANVVTWPVRKILWPPVRTILQNPIKSTLIAAAAFAIGVPLLAQYFGSIEGSLVGVAHKRMVDAIRSLRFMGTSVPGGPLPIPEIPGGGIA